MVQWSLLLSSTAVLAQKQQQSETVTRVNFGNYNGTYEGDIEDMIPLSFGNLKQRSSQGSPQMTPDVRRYSHLKLMISYVMGSGAIAARYTSYGCHCSLGPDATRTNPKIASRDVVDEVCRRQTMCLQCAKIDNDQDCEGGKKGYSFSGHVDSNGKRYIKCLNTPGTCRHSLCLCDSALAIGFRDSEDSWSQPLHREWGGFNFNRQCVAHPPTAKPNLPPTPAPTQYSGTVARSPSEARERTESALYKYEYKDDYVYDYPESTTVGYETESAGAGYGGGNGGAESDNGYQADETGMFNNLDSDQSAGYASGSASGSSSGSASVTYDMAPSMQCCGEYPERFPYKIGPVKQCCGSTTFNPFVMQCCSGSNNDVRPLGTC